MTHQPVRSHTSAWALRTPHSTSRTPATSSNVRQPPARMPHTHRHDLDTTYSQLAATCLAPQGIRRGNAGTGAAEIRWLTTLKPGTFPTRKGRDASARVVGAASAEIRSRALTSSLGSH